MKKVIKKLSLFLAVLMLMGSCFVEGVFFTPINVSAASKSTVKVQSITLNKKTATVLAGKKLTLKATVKPKSSAKKVLWKTSNKKIATVSSNGVVTAKSAGKASITAYFKGSSKKAVCKITVNRPVSKISLKSTNLSLFIGKTYKIQATVTPKNASNKALKYTSSNTKIATVSSSGTVTAKGVGKAKITVTAKDGSGKKTTLNVTVNRPVSSVAVKSATIELFVGKTQNITTTVTPSNASNKAVSYTSGNTKIATVSSSGVVTAKSAGTTKITVTAKDGSGKKATVNVTVKTPVNSVKLRSESIAIFVGKTASANAKVEPGNATNKSLSYVSSDTSIATVDQNGIITAVSAGTANITITAKDGSGKSAVLSVAVKVPVNSIDNQPVAVSLFVSKTQQITSTVLPVDASDKSLKYESEDETVATVNENGLITAVKAGTTKIKVSAKDGSDISAQIDVTVTVPVGNIAVDSSDVNVMIGKTKSIETTVTPENATDNRLSFESSNTSVATVDQNGVITAVSEGTANITITAKDGSGKSAVVSVRSTIPVSSIGVEKSSVSLFVSKTMNISTTVSPINAWDKSLKYESSDTSVATVSSTGTITAVSKGNATITVSAKDGSGVSTEIAVTVTIPVSTIEVDSSSFSLMAGKTKSIVTTVSPEYATDKGLSFESSNTSVATVDQNGVITAVSAGTANITITAKDGSGVSKVISLNVLQPVTGISISPTSVSLTKGATKSISVNVSPENAYNKAFTVTSDDTDIATVSDDGTITAVNLGTTTVTFKTVDGEKTAVCSVSVIDNQGEKTVTNQTELNTALANKNISRVIVDTNEQLTLNIAQGTYTDKDIIVNAPNLHMDNYGNFNSIDIKAIGPNSWKEFANGNVLNVGAPSAKVIITEDASASLNMIEGAGDVNIINDGVINQLNIQTPTNLNISGDSTQNNVPVRITENAENTNINTEQPLNINTDAPVNLNIGLGAEQTVVKAATSDDIPTVKGLGRIETTVIETNQVVNIVATSDEQYEINVKVAGSVYDASMQPISGANVYLVKYSADIDTNNISNYYSTPAATTSSAGSFTTDEYSIGNYYMVVTAEGYSDVLETLVLTSNESDTFYLQNIIMTVKQTSQRGKVYGTGRDAQTGNSISKGITLNLREGRNNLSDKIIKTVTTDTDGNYSFDDLPYGQYTVQVTDFREDVDNHYNNTYFNVVVSEADNNFDFTATLSLGDGNIRFVLTWGDEESGASSDLDSHLAGPAPDGQFHTWYSVRDYYYGGEKYDDLDVDDTTWEGPETTTIYKLQEGVYHFYIHDYSNRGSTGSTQMSLSSAKVDVYVGTQKVATYNCPNKAGNLWHVCDYDSKTNQFTPFTNVIDYYGELSEIGIDLVELYFGKLSSAIKSLEDVVEQIADTEIKNSVQDMIDSGKNVLNNSDSDESALISEYNKINDWISNNLSICLDGISALDKDSNELIYDYYSDTTERILTIVGNCAFLPENIQIRPGNNDTVEIKQEGDDYVAVFTKPSGIKLTYKIVYNVNRNILAISKIQKQGEDVYFEGYCYDDYINILYPKDSFEDLTFIPVSDDVTVSDVKNSEYDGKYITVTLGDTTITYYLNEISSPNLRIDSVRYNGDWMEWGTDYRYDGDENEYMVLRIYPTGTIDYNQLEIIPRNSNVTTEITDSDKPGFVKIVTLKLGEYSTVFYIEINISESALTDYNVQRGDDSSWYSANTYWINDEEYAYYLNIWLYSVSDIENFVITPHYSDTTISEITDSDLDEFDKMFTATAGEKTCKVYIKFDTSNIFGISYFRLNDSTYSDWYSNTIQYGGKTCKTCNISAYKKLSLDNLEVIPNNQDITVSEITDSDNPDYDKMFTLSYGNFSQVFYIRSEYAPWAYCDLTISDGENTLSIENSSRYSENNNYYFIIDIIPASFEEVTELTITPYYNFVTVSDITQSDKQGYDGMFTASTDERTVNIYFRFDYNGLLSINSVKNGDNYIDWYTGNSWDDGQEYYVLTVRPTTALDYADLVITSSLNGATVSAITDSDRSGYEKMVTLSYGDYSRTYYIRKQYNSDVYQSYTIIDGNNQHTEWTDSYWDDEKQCNCYELNITPNSLDSNMDNITINPYYSAATMSEITESDREGYDGMFTVSTDEETINVYLRLDYSNLLSINSVKNGDNSISWGTDWEYDDNNKKYYELELYPHESLDYADLVIDSSLNGATVSAITDSDRIGYEKMFTISYGDYSRTYYIEKQYHSDVYNKFSVKDGDNQYTRWSNCYWDAEKQCNYYGLNITPSSFDLTLNDITVNSYYSVATMSEITESDREGYDGMFTVSTDEKAVSVYLRLDYSGLLGIDSVKNGDNYIDWYTGNGWDDGREYYVLTVCPTTALDYADLVIDSSLNGATVSAITDSDRSGYEKMVTINYSDYSRTYHIKKQYNSSVYNKFSVKDGNNQYTQWANSRWDDEKQCHYYELNITPSSFDSTLNDITINPYYSVAEMSEITESDREGYDGMFTVSTEQETVKVYIKYDFNNLLSICDVTLANQDSTKESDFYWMLDYGYDNNSGTVYWYVLLESQEEIDLEDVIVTPTSDQVTVSEFTESDREDFQKMFTLSYGEHSRTFYI